MLSMSVPRKDLGPGREHIYMFENCLQYNISFKTVYPEDEPWLWPNTPNTSWPTMYCAKYPKDPSTGIPPPSWEYDRREYENSLVTEVSLEEKVSVNE